MGYRGAALLGLLLLGAGAATAQVPDPHRLYHEKCAACHVPHAGDFAWDALILDGAVLVGRNSGRPLRGFLQAGHGGLTGEEAQALADLFTAIRESGRLFRTKCRICHESAVTLARRELILKDGRLTGRYTGRDIETFLNVHGRLDASEAATMLDILTRALTTRDRDF